MGWLSDSFVCSKSVWSHQKDKGVLRKTKQMTKPHKASHWSFFVLIFQNGPKYRIVKQKDDYPPRLNCSYCLINWLGCNSAWNCLNLSSLAGVWILKQCNKCLNEWGESSDSRCNHLLLTPYEQFALQKKKKNDRISKWTKWSQNLDILKTTWFFFQRYNCIIKIKKYIHLFIHRNDCNNQKSEAMWFILFYCMI